MGELSVFLKNRCRTPSRALARCGRRRSSTTVAAVASAPFLRRAIIMPEGLVKCELTARDFLLEASQRKLVRGRLTSGAGRARTRIFISLVTRYIFVHIKRRRAPTLASSFCWRSIHTTKLLRWASAGTLHVRLLRRESPRVFVEARAGFTTNKPKPPHDLDDRASNRTHRARTGKLPFYINLVYRLASSHKLGH